MKRLMWICAPLLCATLVLSCQKELSFETGFSTPATGSLQDTTGECNQIVANGNYVENQDLNTTNTVTVTVNVTTPGSYRIATDTVNGFWFADSGFFSAAGQQTVNLRGFGRPTNATTTNFNVSFQLSVCSFSVDVFPANAPSGGVNDADTAWMFNQGASHFRGRVDSAVVRTAGGIAFLNIYGKRPMSDTSFYLQLQQSSPTAPPSGSYSSANGMAVFEFKTPAGNMIYESRQGDGSDIVFTVTNYDAGTRVLEGNFSGTARDSGGTNINIASGRVKVQVQ